MLLYRHRAPYVYDFTHADAHAGAHAGAHAVDLSFSRLDLDAQVGKRIPAEID